MGHKNKKPNVVDRSKSSAPASVTEAMKRMEELTCSIEEAAIRGWDMAKNSKVTGEDASEIQSKLTEELCKFKAEMQESLNQMQAQRDADMAGMQSKFEELLLAIQATHSAKEPTVDRSAGILQTPTSGLLKTPSKGPQSQIFKDEYDKYEGGNTVNQLQLEEDSGCKIVLEPEESKLKETSEIPRLVENEAEKKHLAKAAISNDEVVIGQGKYNDIDMEPMVQKNGGLGKGKGFYERTLDLDAEKEDSYTCQELPVMSKNGMPQRDFVKVGDLVVAHDDIVAGHSSEFNVCPTGLNEIDEYDCLLNVIIQSLWRLRRFRNEILSKLKHKHVGNPCVECVLFDIFTALNTDAVAVPTTSLGTALSSLYPKSNFFQEGQMNDASEVLDVLFDCLHVSFTWPSSVYDPESIDSNSSGCWNCSSSTCIVHSFFGMNVLEEMNCYNCHLKSRRLKYTTFSHDIYASSLRTVKDMFPESSFDDILNLLEMHHMLPCDQEAGGCGKDNIIHHNLSNPPHVFIIVLDWQDTCGDDKIIDKTLRALSTEMNVCSIYRNLDLKNRRSLVSMVCYYGKNHYCLAYTHDHKQWMMYDNETVKVIGSWDDVLSMCVKRLLQPQILFFEAVTS